MSVLRRTKQAQVFLQKESEMIDFKTIAIGDKVKVVGAGAPGFAELGDELEITKTLSDRVFARRADVQFTSVGVDFRRDKTGQYPARTSVVPSVQHIELRSDVRLKSVNVSICCVA